MAELPDPAKGSPASNPEATGGKGTVAEHRYGARLLASMLAKAPVDALGGALVPTKVVFQAAGPVDDLVVTAEGAGATVTWHVAGRMTPTIGPSAADTVALFGRCLHVVAAAPDDARGGALRLGLAVVGAHGPAELLGKLCDIARGSPDAFRPTVARRSNALQERRATTRRQRRVARRSG
jgi:hypothetical protein